jgi:hypothetical protein
MSGMGGGAPRRGVAQEGIWNVTTWSTGRAVEMKRRNRIRYVFVVFTIRWVSTEHSRSVEVRRRWGSREGWEENGRAPGTGTR